MFRSFTVLLYFCCIVTVCEFLSDIWYTKIHTKLVVKATFPVRTGSVIKGKENVLDSELGTFVINLSYVIIADSRTFRCFVNSLLTRSVLEIGVYLAECKVLLDV